MTLETLAVLDASTLRHAACKSIAANLKMFAPDADCATQLRERNGDAVPAIRSSAVMVSFMSSSTREQPPESLKD